MSFVSQANAAAFEVKNRVGTGSPRPPIPGPKLACTRSTAELPRSAIRGTKHLRPHCPRAARVGVAAPAISTSTGRRYSPLSSSTAAKAAAASAAVIGSPGVHGTHDLIGRDGDVERLLRGCLRDHACSIGAPKIIYLGVSSNARGG